MSKRKTGRITVQSQPTKETRMMEKILLIPFLVVGIIFVVIGITVAIPMAGLFGVAWTLIAVCFVVIALLNLLRKNGPAHRVGYDIETDMEQSIVGMMDEVPESNAAPIGETEARLAELRRLYEQRLITQEEYDTKRKEILERL